MQLCISTNHRMVKLFDASSHHDNLYQAEEWESRKISDNAIYWHRAEGWYIVLSHATPPDRGINLLLNLRFRLILLTFFLIDAKHQRCAHFSFHKWKFWVTVQVANCADMVVSQGAVKTMIGAMSCTMHKSYLLPVGIFWNSHKRVPFISLQLILHWFPS